MEPSAIITALRARAVAAGYTVVLYRTVDPETDSLPVVLFHSHEEAREADPEAHGLVHRLLDITIGLIDEGDDDHVIEALETAEQLAADLVQIEHDVPDRLGIGLNSLEVIETRVDSRTSSTDVVVIEVLIRASYIGANT